MTPDALDLLDAAILLCGTLLAAALEGETTMWSVYQCDRLGLGRTPESEREVASGFQTASDAMRVANALKRANPGKSYTVGCAE